MGMTEQQAFSEALYLATELKIGCFSPNVLQNEQGVRQKAANELRRLHDCVVDLRAELVVEAARTAEQKLRADQMTRQHADQSKMNAGSRHSLAACHQELDELKAKIARIGLDVDAAMRGQVNESSPIASRLKMLASLQSQKP